MDPLTAGITFTAGSAGAGAGAGGAAAAMSNPITAAIALAALATAYGTSPSVRKGTNKAVKSGWEYVSNPFQHFGDGSEKDTLPLSKLLQGKNPIVGNGILDDSSTSGIRGQVGGIAPQPSILEPLFGTQQTDNPRQPSNQQRQKQDNSQSAVVDRFLQSLSSQPLDVGYFNAPRASQFVAPEPKYLTTQPMQMTDPFASRRRAY